MELILLSVRAFDEFSDDAMKGKKMSDWIAFGLFGSTE
jgi:hypothetical protein